MRFYEFSDLDLDEDLSTALNTKKRQLDNQAKEIANRKIGKPKPTTVRRLESWQAGTLIPNSPPRGQCSCSAI